MTLLGIMIDYSWQEIVAFLTLAGGAIAYLVRIERVMTQLSTTIGHYCKESAVDRQNIWVSITKIQENNEKSKERLARLEEKTSRRAAHE